MFNSAKKLCSYKTPWGHPLSVQGFSSVLIGVIASLAVLGAPVSAKAQSSEAQTAPLTSAKTLKRTFDYINGKVLTMAQDFPESKYNYRLKPEMRSFGELIVHIASGNVYAGKAGRGEKVNWDELPAANYKTKAECVALLQKSIDEANSALKEHPEGWRDSLEPFLSVIQHSSEHYGLLVAYYRANGLIPPESRPKK
jgi:hypothetical protein